MNISMKRMVVAGLMAIAIGFSSLGALPVQAHTVGECYSYLPYYGKFQTWRANELVNANQGWSSRKSDDVNYRHVYKARVVKCSYPVNGE